MSARAHVVVGGALAVVCLVYLTLPSLAASVVESGLGVACVLVMSVGVLRRRTARLPWGMLTLGMAAAVAGDVLWTRDQVRGVQPSVPSLPDGLYLGSYPLLAIGLYLLLRRHGRHEWVGWLDATMWTVGALVLAWVPLLAPYAHDAALGTGERVTDLLYPLLDLLLLLVVLRVLARRGLRDRGIALVALSFTAMLAADVVFGVRSLSGTYVDGEPTDLGWILSYGLLTWGCWLPTTSMQPAEVAKPTQRRLVALTAPTLSAPFVLVLLVARGDLRGDETGAYLVAASTALLFLLAGVRGRTLITQLRATVADRERLADELRSRAASCALTGLPNRSGFLELVDLALASNEPIAVGLLDLDDFKGVNDTLGHDAGDTLLVEVAVRLRAALGAHDVVGRLGGDEFALLLRGDEAQVSAVADAVLEAMSPPMVLDGSELRVECSLGVVHRREASSLSDMMRRADVAMYAAKAAGGSRWAGYRPEMSAALLKRMDLRSQLVLALERGELVPWYQPVVDLETGELVGCEALARWIRRGRAPEAPGEWMPLAEETGLIVDIDHALMARALRDFASWRSVSPDARDLELALNVSGRTLQSTGAAEHVLGLLTDLGIPPSRLLLEVTEGVLLDDEAVGRRLQRLRSAGVRIALDDFGTGWSSLAYLAKFPVDVLKLDRSFTAGLGQDIGSEAVAAAVVQLAQALELEVIAEGIETEAQSQRLEALGARFGQGFLFSAAVPGEALRARLRDSGVERSVTALRLA